MFLLSNARLSVKLAVGFSAVLLLTIIVAVAGYGGLAVVIDGVEKSDVSGEMVVSILEARQQELTYNIHNKDENIQGVNNRIRALKKQAGSADRTFEEITDRNRIKQVISRADTYQTAFDNYVALNRERQISMEEMNHRADEALLRSEAIDADQKVQLAEQRKEAEIQLETKIRNAGDTSRIIMWFLDTRLYEKEYMLSGGRTEWEAKVFDGIEKILELIQDLQFRFQQSDNIEAANTVIQAVKDYRSAFSEVFELVMKQRQSREKMAEGSAALFEALEIMRGGLKLEIGILKKKAATGGVDVGLFFDTKLSTFLDTTEAMRFFFNVLQAEKEFIASAGEEEWRDEVENNLGIVRSRLVLIKYNAQKAKVDWSVKQMEEILAQIDAYEEAFDELAGFFDKQKTWLKCEPEPIRLWNDVLPSRMINSACSSKCISRDRRF